MHGLRIIQLFRFLRPVNLLIMAATQLLTKYCLLDVLYTGSGDGSMPAMALWGLVTATVLIAAGGNLYNDLRDVGIDRVNKPGTTLITDIFPVNQVALMWNMLMIVGTALGILTSFLFGMFWLSVLFVLSAVLLIMYSRRWKGELLKGNLVVSALSAMTILVVVWAAHLRTVSMDIGISWLSEAWVLSSYFMVFAFLSTLVRELIKDLEDVEGDSRAGLRTLAISAPGTSSGISILALTGLQLTMGVFLVWLYQKTMYMTSIGLVALMIYCFIMIFNVLQAKGMVDYSRLSRRLKAFMVLGMLLMILIAIEWNDYGLNFLKPGG